MPGVHPLPTAAAPKISALARLQAAGLPVPDAIALPAAREPDLAAWTAIDELLRGGPVIVRAALFGEDTLASSGAGLGTSVAGCRDRAAVRAALAHIAAALAEPWLRGYFPEGALPAAQVLVQREVVGPWLAVVAQAELRYAEIHRRDRAEPLASGATPDLAGPLDLLPDALRRPIARLCAQVSAALPDATHGLDLELVADQDGAVWVVQARPLTRPLHPGWPAFAAAARRDLDPIAGTCPQGQALALPGLWLLDVEHNPAPLSPAHAGLIRRLAAARPELAPMRVLAGWLYDRRGPRPTAASPTRGELVDALDQLRRVHIPAARRGLAQLDAALEHADAHALADLLDRACARLLAVLAVYAALPRAVASAAAPSGPPLCLEDRDAHLDVLPAAWDIASPTLLDLSSGTDHDLALAAAPAGAPTSAPSVDPGPSAPAPAQEADPGVLAVRLGELDDHLFALGLAPVRRVYLRAATRLGVSADDVFLLPPDTLQDALRGRIAALDLPGRRAESQRQAELLPPLQLFDGLPVPTLGGASLRGLPIGPAAEGPLHPRRDLADLIARPPPPGAVLALPALTAQAAVVLRALGVRAVCSEHGGAMSHAALMARELGLSALLGCRGCTALAPGTPVRLDPRTGRLLHT